MKPSYNYYLLAKHPDWASKPRCWSIMLEPSGVKYYGGANVDGYTRLKNTPTLQLPENAGFKYNNMQMFRYVEKRTRFLVCTPLWWPMLGWMWSNGPR